MSWRMCVRVWNQFLVLYVTKVTGVWIPPCRNNNNNNNKIVIIIIIIITKREKRTIRVGRSHFNLNIIIVRDNLVGVNVPISKVEDFRRQNVIIKSICHIILLCTAVIPWYCVELVKERELICIFGNLFSPSAEEKDSTTYHNITIEKSLTLVTSESIVLKKMMTFASVRISDESWTNTGEIHKCIWLFKLDIIIYRVC